jgi:hypothetical protein
MSATPDETILSGRKLTSTVELTGGTVVPSRGLFQPPFELSEADFLRLQKTDPITAFGVGITGFALTFTLPLLVQYFWPSLGEGPVSNARWVVAAALIVLGATVWIVGRVASRERRKIMKRIENHFLAHPNQKMSVRGGKRA